MKNTNCLTEKIFTRWVGGFLLVISLVIAFIGSLFSATLGILLMIPLLLFALGRITVPLSKACRL